MALPQNFNDGAVQYGSKVLTIETATYVADNISVTRPSNEIKRTDEKGRPSGFVNVPDVPTGDATLQLADASAVPPERGDTFTVTLSSKYGAEEFVITEVGNTFTKEGETKVPVKFRFVVDEIVVETAPGA